MLLITQPHLLTGGVSACAENKCLALKPKIVKYCHEERGVFYGEDHSVRVWKIFVDLCGCTSFKALVVRAFTFRLLSMG